MIRGYIMKESQYFTPSVAECRTAERTFLQAFQRYSFGNSRKIAIRCALDAVWETARRYQAELEATEQEYQCKLISTHVLHAEDDSKNRENSLSSLT